MKRMLFALAAVAMLCTAVSANDWAPPDPITDGWMRGDPGSTYQQWDFTLLFEGTPGEVIPPGQPIGPSDSDNPYGESHGPPFDMPFVEWPAEGEVVTVEGPGGDDVEVLHIGGPEGTYQLLRIWIPNDPSPNPLKKLKWQMTSTKSPTPQGDPPMTDPPGASIPGASSSQQIGLTGWYDYTGTIQILPNPDGEWLIFELAQCTHIDQIVVDTICSVPEPATMALVGLGIAGLVARRRRR